MLNERKEKEKFLKKVSNEFLSKNIQVFDFGAEKEKKNIFQKFKNSNLEEIEAIEKTLGCNILIKIRNLIKSDIEETLKSNLKFVQNRLMSEGKFRTFFFLIDSADIDGKKVLQQKMQTFNHYQKFENKILCELSSHMSINSEEKRKIPIFLNSYPEISSFVNSKSDKIDFIAVCYNLQRCFPKKGFFCISKTHFGFFETRKKFFEGDSKKHFFNFNGERRECFAKIEKIDFIFPRFYARKNVAVEIFFSGCLSIFIIFKGFFLFINNY